MNKVFMIGRLTRDPVIFNSDFEESMVADFTLAVDRRVRPEAESNRQTADFISCAAFGRRADFVQKYLHQGSKIAVIGRIETGSYMKETGEKVYTTEVVVDEIDFAESKNEINEGSPEL